MLLATSDLTLTYARMQYRVQTCKMKGPQRSDMHDEDTMQKANDVQVDHSHAQRNNSELP